MKPLKERIYDNTGVWHDEGRQREEEESPTPEVMTKVPLGGVGEEGGRWVLVVDPGELPGVGSSL